MDKQAFSIATMVGQSVLAGMITGFAGLVVATFAFFGGDWIGAGICLAASAVAFGLLANALLRD
jgi:hypothetical protein